ncbi:hypothetical protein GC105_14025 [Alkalibaculum sp. M08DMB]|uniref:FMN-binding protein n=1 Tax=Alkalibaculum sporogenes TaxID=2655001 RepID=A0A6A7KBG7_9FIRM|nr:hypothetical protein [Alkalibaculum sporogenes]MPW26899.1 hypothetical protein [Alkalibaculum sporogenes]
MKKIILLLLSLTLIASFAIGCASGGSDEPTSGEGVTYKDGVYYAEEETFADGNGYKYFVVVTVADGKISDAEWGGTNVQVLGNKKTLSEEGKYGMEWHPQAEAAEAWLIENQDPAAFDELYTTDEGHTDALKTDAGTSVSIHVVEFFDLAKKALASEPVAEGAYTTPSDFVATATLPLEEEDVWEYRADFTVVNGTIVASNFNSVFVGEKSDDTEKYFDGDKALSKKELGVDYGMDWASNAEKSDAFLLETQGFTVNYIDDKGHTDTIAGVSIHVNEFEDLFNSALGN